MSRKLLWIIVPLALATTALVLLVPARPGGARRISARFVRQTTDGAGNAHVFYEIRNETRRPSEVMVDPPLQVLHERTGWWEAEGWSTAWHVEQAAGIAKDAQRAELRPRSSGTLEIRIQGLFGGGSALRGRVRTVKVETEAVLRLRAIAHSLGVPPRWQMLPKPRLVELPQVAIQRSATSAAGAATVAAPPPTPTSATAGVNSATALSAASDGAGEIVAPGGLQFRNASIGTVLDLYAVLANAQLEVDARVRASRATFSLTNTEALSQTGAMRLLEQVLEQQGGIVIQRVDSQHVRVIPIEAQAAKRDSK